MSFLATGTTNYNSRIARAGTLAERYPFAASVLIFYARVADFQRTFSEQLPQRWGQERTRAGANGEFRVPLKTEIVLEPFAEFLQVVEAAGPQPLADAASTLSRSSASERNELLAEFWKTGLRESSELDSKARLWQFLARAFLQPYAEFVAGAMLPPALPMTACRCPHCNSLPLLGVLRPEGDGGKRFLVCSFCSLEWEFRRIFCAQCGEESEGKLPVYIAEEFPHVRVECCEACRHFLRTIDLTKDGHAVPLVDDLAAIPLTLWADEHGYKRIQANLLAT